MYFSITNVQHPRREITSFSFFYSFPPNWGRPGIRVQNSLGASVEGKITWLVMFRKDSELPCCDPGMEVGALFPDPSDTAGDSPSLKTIYFFQGAKFALRVLAFVSPSLKVTCTPGCFPGPIRIMERGTSGPLGPGLHGPRRP